ncbi:MAG: helix-turn-helix domain-containing protein [Candidatus Binatia bacterium]
MSRKKVAKSYISLDGLAIGVRLKSERQRLGLTQEEVARHVGLKSKSAIKNYEKGQVPGPEILSRLAALFGKSIDWLLSSRESGEPIKAAELPERYRRLDRTDRKILREVEELLRQAAPDIKQHLRSQIALLRRAAKSWEERKASGED